MKAVTLPRRELTSWIVDWVAGSAQMSRDTVEPDHPFGDYGLSSVKLVSLSGELGDLLGRELPVDIAYSFPTVAALADHLSAAPQEAPSGGPAVVGAPEDAEPIAVVGVGCRFPGDVHGPDQYWQFLLDGGTGIRRIPEGRWSSLPVGDPSRSGSAGLGGFLDGIEEFDASFFGISPHEATMMDPQQRLVLEVAWEALEHAGIPPHTLRGERAGVFIGAATSDYAPSNAQDMGGWSATGASMGVIASRLSYVLGARGPSMLVDTACSASLVAIHLACRSLRSGESSLALAGGVNLLLTPAVSVAFEEAGVLSPDGHCRTFDAQAHGYGRAEGSGVVVLKRLTDARRDQDRVLAVVCGSAINHNGRSNGLMAPSRTAQAELLQAAYQDAGIPPAAVDYIEAHGTGTVVGDPIEIGAITEVTGEGRAADRPLLLGAVKTNLGHLEAAAGVAGFVKTVLALHHGEIPPTLNFAALNPAVPADAPVSVVTGRTSWPTGRGTRTAGVSAFGFGGANAHVVLQEAPPAADRQDTAPPTGTPRPVVVTVDGSSVCAYQAEAAQLRDWLSEHRDEVTIKDLAHTTTVRRTHGPLRAAVVARDTGTLLDRLDLLATEGGGGGITTGTERHSAQPVFVFSGQGSQWAGMARELLTEDPVFTRVLTELDTLIGEESGFSVREVLENADDAALAPIDVVQPVLFAVQVALAAAWQARGVEPVAVIGHSMGEAAAAVVSGALTRQEGVQVTCRRSRLMKRIAGRGAMAVFPVAAQAMEEYLSAGGAAGSVTTAAHLSPTATVVSGSPEAVNALLDSRAQEGIDGLLVQVDVASHSPQVDQILGELADELAALRPRPPRIPLYSTVAAGREARMDAQYWVDNLREPVMLADAVRAAAQDGHEVFVEVSPHPVLARPLHDTLDAIGITDAVIQPTLRRGEHPLEVLAEGSARLHCHGHRIVWNQVWAGGTLLALPPRNWDHQPYWLADAPPPAAVLPSAEHPLLGHRTEPADRPGTFIWQAALTAPSLPWLTQHTAAGSRSLPAGAHGELMLAAGRAIGLRSPAVRDLAFYSPVPTDSAPLTLQTVCTTDPGAPSATVQVFARAEGAHEWQQCASARLHANAGPLLSGPPPARPAGTAVLAAEHYASAERHGLVLGAALRTVEELFTGPGTAEALLGLPGSAGEDSRYVIHPALLTGCLETLAAAAGSARPQGAFTVAGIGSMRTASSENLAVTRVTAAVSPGSAGDTVEGSCTLWSGDLAVAELTGVRLARVAADDDGAGAVTPPEWSLDLVWQPEPVSAPARRAGGDWLVIGDHPDLIAALRALGVRCHVLPTPPAQGEEAWAARLTTALEAHGTLDRVLFAAGLGVRGSAPASAASLTSAAVTAVRALASAGSGAPLLSFVTCGAQRIGHEDTLNPSQAVLWGLGRSVSLEHPGLWGSLIDLDQADTASWAEQILGAAQGDQSAFRAGVRHVPRLTPSAPAADPAAVGPEPDPPFGGGSHLVVGASGSLAPHLIRQLVGLGARCLVLLSRKPAEQPDPATSSLPEGIRIVRVAADVADQEALAELFARFGTDLPPLRAVYHAAFSRQVVPIVDMTRAHIDDMFRAKVTGSAALHTLAADHHVADMVSLSSTTGLLGSGGLAHYAAASCYQDMLAHAWSRRGLRVRTLVLGPCAEGLAGTPEADVVKASGLRLMPGRLALAPVRDLLTQRREHLVVADADWAEVATALAMATGSPLLDTLTGARSPAKGEQRPPVVLSTPPAGNDVKAHALAPPLSGVRTRQALETLVQQEVARAMGCAPAAVRTRQNLFSLGMDSLMSLVVLRRLRAELALDLDPKDLHQHPTVASLAAFLSTFSSGFSPDSPSGTAKEDHTS
ncbi:SDR family NAD(P)-dependent oxidoreductase [Streptomyces sp. A5-4]|uniref:SDR family NAD(P)-dependent oxidoreductase n=1 Tax=Streptomyces sp. A5-4 TaxID=3384771 RepID=UPI003DA8BBE6